MGCLSEDGRCPCPLVLNPKLIYHAHCPQPIPISLHPPIFPNPLNLSTLLPFIIRSTNNNPKLLQNLLPTIPITNAHPITPHTQHTFDPFPFISHVHEVPCTWPPLAHHSPNYFSCPPPSASPIYQSPSFNLTQSASSTFIPIKLITPRKPTSVQISSTVDPKCIASGIKYHAEFKPLFSRTVQAL